MKLFFSKLGYAGRASNIMFEIACLVGTAKKYNCEWYVPTPIPHMSSMNKEMIAPDYDLYFKERLKNHSMDVGWINQQQNRFNYYYYSTEYKPVDLSMVHPNAVVDFDGNLQSPKYFENAEAEVRRLFSLDAYKNLTSSALKALKAQFGKTRIITVGVRLTDYVELNWFYHKLIDTDYYRNAFNYFNEKYNHDCLFLVV